MPHLREIRVRDEVFGLGRSSFQSTYTSGPIVVRNKQFEARISLLSETITKCHSQNEGGFEIQTSFFLFSFIIRSFGSASE